jgi:RNA polymerase-binding protein DksA
MSAKLKKADLEKFREILETERRRLLKNVQRSDKIISHEDGEYESGAGRAHSNHMADQGSDEFEYETQLLLSASQRTRLREIDEALQRIEDGTYGICEKTGKPIAKARLRAIPTARLCIEAQEQEEEEAARRSG